MSEEIETYANMRNATTRRAWHSGVQALLAIPDCAHQIVAETGKALPNITVAQAREEMDQGEVGLLLEVREPSEWELLPELGTCHGGPHSLRKT